MVALSSTRLFLGNSPTTVKGARRSDDEICSSQVASHPNRYDASPVLPFQVLLYSLYLAHQWIDQCHSRSMEPIQSDSIPQFYSIFSFCRCYEVRETAIDPHTRAEIWLDSYSLWPIIDFSPKSDSLHGCMKIQNTVNSLAERLSNVTRKQFPLRVRSINMGL